MCGPSLNPAELYPLKDTTGTTRRTFGVAVITDDAKLRPKRLELTTHVHLGQWLSEDPSPNHTTTTPKAELTRSAVAIASEETIDQDTVADICDP